MANDEESFLSSDDLNPDEEWRSLMAALGGSQAAGGPSGNSKRMHHYIFAHQDLPEQVFADPAAFVTLMNSTVREDWLGRLWSKSGDSVVSARQGQCLPSTGLAVTQHEFHCGSFPVIEFPRPEATVEAFFATVVKPAHAEWRYFVLERAEFAEEVGILCEWLADRGRRNHQMQVAASASQFVAAINKQLYCETTRIDGAATPISGIEWNPSNRETVDDALLRPGAFRAQHCFFSFDAVPTSWAKQRAKWMEGVERDQAQSILDLLWLQAGELAAQCDRGGELPADGLKGEVVLVVNTSCLLITMPQAISPPECIFVLVPLGAPSNAAEQHPIITLELADTGLVVGSIDDAHAILGTGRHADQAGFINDVSEFVFGPKNFPEAPSDTMRQLLLYAEISNFCRNPERDMEFPAGFADISKPHGSGNT